MEVLYMRVTKDKYELPVAVAGSSKELADMLGVKPNNVSSSISRGCKGYCKIVIDEKGEDNVRDQ